MTLTHAPTTATAREAAETLKMFTEQSPEYLKHVANGTIKLPTDSMIFACVGCGWNCCSRGSWLPRPEYIRIVWKLRRAKLLALAGHLRVYMLASALIAGAMLDPKVGKNGHYCSFLAPAR